MANATLVAHLRRAGRQPVGDAVRDDIAARLSDAFTEGSLSTEAYQGLLEQAFAARTCEDLVPVAEQLPSTSVSNVPAIVAQRTTPGQLAPIRSQGAAARRLAAVGAPVAVVAIGVVLLVAHLLHLL